MAWEGAAVEAAGLEGREAGRERSGCEGGERGGIEVGERVQGGEREGGWRERERKRQKERKTRG